MQVALRKTKNDDFAALLILTCPQDTDANKVRLVHVVSILSTRPFVPDRMTTLLDLYFIQTQCLWFAIIDC